tara:strand:+ start:265 stop:1539 length:1275 start_codon:yes stop_codon:yes gene_type:complete
MSYNATSFFIIAITLVAIGTTAMLIKHSLAPLREMINAMDVGVRSFKNNDFSITIHNKQYDELGKLLDTYNELSQVLREQRLTLFQREQLLNRVIQETPVAIMLTNDKDRIMLSNTAAKHLLGYHQRLDGELLPELIDGMPTALQQATRDKRSGLFSEMLANEKISYSLTCHHLTLNNKSHQLFLYKNLTKDISRKESDIWKKAIRLISHELNNSLAPLKSLTSSAKKIIDAPEHLSMLPSVLDTISERIESLHVFLTQYATYARLPAPKMQSINLNELAVNVAGLMNVKVSVSAHPILVDGDKAQLEQALLNLIKNATESGSELERIEVSLSQQQEQTLLSVTDGGQGMSEQQLQQALLPFYTTKHQGSGLGLALCNDIVVAHAGKLTIRNLESEEITIGLQVVITLPLSKLNSVNLNGVSTS